MTPAEWARCLSLTAALWPSRPVEPETAEAWYPLLADLDVDVVTTGLRRLALEPGREWPPGPGAIRQAAVPPARPWETAVAELVAAVHETGAYRPAPSFADSALGAVVAAYGWATLCRLDLTDATTRAQVRECYLSAQRHGTEVQRHSLAAGSPRRGLRSGRPVPVGEVAAQVVADLGDGAS